jgi:hypothetical protein
VYRRQQLDAVAHGQDAGDPQDVGAGALVSFGLQY